MIFFVLAYLAMGHWLHMFTHASQCHWHTLSLLRVPTSPFQRNPPPFSFPADKPLRTQWRSGTPDHMDGLLPMQYLNSVTGAVCESVGSNFPCIKLGIVLITELSDTAHLLMTSNTATAEHRGVAALHIREQVPVTVYISPTNLHVVSRSEDWHQLASR